MRGKAYSEDLRVRAVGFVESGKDLEEVASMFSISRATLYRWVLLKKTTKSCAPKKGFQKGYGHKIIDLIQFRKFVDENKNLTLKELAAKIGNVSYETVRRALKKIGYSKKKELWI